MEWSPVQKHSKHQPKAPQVINFDSLINKVFIRIVCIGLWGLYPCCTKKTKTVIMARDISGGYRERMKKGMEYVQAREYIASANSFGVVPGLDTIRALLEELGNPQDKLRFIHIAGTNGKGSVGAYLSYILAASGYRVGRYVSPTVFDECESIQFLESSGKKEEKKRFSLSMIEKDRVAEFVSMIKASIERMKEKGWKSHPTAFEIETAMAFLAFLEQKCDLVVLEAGLGGRLDATNIVKTVVCSVIVSISRDHMAFLGDTLKEIAEEKAGIIKMGVPVVSSPQKLEVEEILKIRAKEKRAEIRFADSCCAKMSNIP